MNNDETYDTERNGPRKATGSLLLLREFTRHQTRHYGESARRRRVAQILLFLLTRRPLGEHEIAWRNPTSVPFRRANSRTPSRGR